MSGTSQERAEFKPEFFREGGGDSVLVCLEWNAIDNNALLGLPHK